MPINQKCEQYNANIDKWNLTKVFYDGEEAVKDCGERFLPKLSGQSTKDYNNYKHQAFFLNAVAEITDLLLGLTFSKDYQLEIPESYLYLVDNITSSGVKLKSFATECMQEQLLTSRGAVLVDMPSANVEGLTKAEYEMLNIRPYLSFYDAQSIINWQTETINNEEVLTLVVFEEEERITDPEDKFNEIIRTKYRELGLLDGVHYYQTIWVEDENGSYIPSETIIPVKNGKTLKKIPLFFFNAKDNGNNITKSAMYDIASYNMHHYINSAHYEHGIKFTALPTLCIKNNRQDNDNVRIGSQSALLLEGEDTDAFFLEFHGKGLSELKEAITEKKEAMYKKAKKLILGGEIANQTATGAKIDRSGETANLITLTSICAMAIEQALKFAVEWAGGNPDEVKFGFTKDFFPSTLNAQEVASFIDSYLKGGISFSTLFHNLSRGEIIPEELTEEDEKEKIDSEMPDMSLDSELL